MKTFDAAHVLRLLPWISELLISRVTSLEVSWRVGAATVLWVLSLQVSMAVSISFLLHICFNLFKNIFNLANKMNFGDLFVLKIYFTD